MGLFSLAGALRFLCRLLTPSLSSNSTPIAGRCHAERDEIAVGAVKYGTVAPLGDRAGGNPFGALRNQ